ncbi:uncharacterized protein LOC123446438 [Hordeum vulgare subsp. vulgare]|uniref:uncharacterized protein LOC123446438 n=1 Tax=Hordeum vulgare subsp. vulgare TaxID=112509 RepID=UPI001D1A37F1|nr:uncharacterized protein LOC123446438 [Hordeum vulgare subsp. vulgare]
MPEPPWLHPWRSFVCTRLEASSPSKSQQITARSVCLALPDLHRRPSKPSTASCAPSSVAIFLHGLRSSFCIEQRRTAPCSDPSPWTVVPAQHGKEEPLPDPACLPWLCYYCSHQLTVLLALVVGKMTVRSCVLR